MPRPLAIWHKSLEDDDSIIGEFFDQRRKRFMRNGNRLLDTLRRTHDLLETYTGKKTNATPRP
jgi:hypothetical protein